jgi:cation diffusion facilitator family transporter
MKDSKYVNISNYGWFSIGAALAIMAIKASAYSLTHSISLLSDALESIINLTAAVFMLRMLIVMAKPPDEEHAYGHEKVEYFSSGFEGILITLAAIGIIYAAVRRLLYPEPIRHLGIGMAISLSASLINFGVAQVLLRAGRLHRSIALEADGQHLMTDVWTSAGVLVGVGSVALTKWQPLDSIIALVVAANIIRTGLYLLRRSVMGLMDTSLPESEVDAINAVLKSYESRGVHYHALRTRQSGARHFVSVHVEVPGDWSVKKSHDVINAIEHDIRRALPSTILFTHIEPIGDPSSYHDDGLYHPKAQANVEASDQPRKKVD